MSDDLVMRLRTSAGIDDVHDAADLIEAQAAEIARLRAACDAYFKTISLSQIRHGRILVGLERRNARHRRALAKLYQRRHDKNAEIASLRARAAELEEALGTLEKAASYTAKLGAVTGAHWLGLGTALIKARAALTGGKDE